MKISPSLDSILAAQQGLPATSLQWLLLEYAKQPDDQSMLKVIKERFGLEDNQEINILINLLDI